jgi:antitoxin CcdA
MRRKHDPVRSGKRKPVNLSMDTGVVEAARAAGINLSQVSEAALRLATKKEQERRRLEDNRGALYYRNEWVEENRLPLEKYRMF